MNVCGGSIRLAVDIGGTFTDAVLEVGSQRYTAKILTTPAAPSRRCLLRRKPYLTRRV